MITVPTSIKNPIKDGILIVTPDNSIKPNEPIRENGIQIITMIENLHDSNCMAMTIKTRKTAVAIAPNNAPNSSIICSST